MKPTVIPACSLEVELPIIDNCSGCGACCLHLDTPPFHGYEWPADEDECGPEMWALFKEIEAIESTQTRLDENGGPCLWFDPVARRCKHYDDRPWMCIDFEVGGEACRAFRAEHRIGEAQ